MKISVVIPVYNCEAYLRACLDSVLSQTHTDLDVLLVDDGSTDGSGRICDAYAARDSRVRVFHTPNRGQSVARNIALDASVGECITFVDADDVVAPRMLAVLSAAMQECGADVAVCDMVRGDEPRFGAPGHVRIDEYASDAAVSAFLYRKRHIGLGPWAHLFRRHVFGSGLRFRPGIIYEDLDLIPKLYATAQKVVFVRSRLYFYRHTVGSSINSWSRRRLDVLDVAEGLEAHFSYDRNLHAAARDRSLSAAFNIYMLNRRHGGADTAVAGRCWRMIRDRRAGAVFNPHVRFKNRMAALLSYCGPAPFNLIARCV